MAISGKDAARQVIDALPDDASLDDILEADEDEPACMAEKHQQRRTKTQDIQKRPMGACGSMSVHQ